MQRTLELLSTIVKKYARLSLPLVEIIMSNESPLVKLLGPSLLSKVGSKISTEDAFRGKELVILYFSASWCPPCQGFTPILVQFYNKCVKEGKIEIVYISSDRTVESFEGYYGKMPWLALPSDPGTTGIKNKLAQLFEITGIPTSIVLQVPSGQYVTDGVRDPVVSAANDKEQALKLVNSWKSMPTVPLEEAAQKRKADMPKQHPLVTLFFFIFKNPMYIFGLLYFFKFVRKQLENSWAKGDALEGEL